MGKTEASGDQHQPQPNSRRALLVDVRDPPNESSNYDEEMAYIDRFYNCSCAGADKDRAATRSPEVVSTTFRGLLRRQSSVSDDGDFVGKSRSRSRSKSPFAGGGSGRSGSPFFGSTRRGSFASSREQQDDPAVMRSSSSMGRGTFRRKSSNVDECDAVSGAPLKKLSAEGQGQEEVYIDKKPPKITIPQPQHIEPRKESKDGDTDTESTPEEPPPSSVVPIKQPRRSILVKVMVLCALIVVIVTIMSILVWLFVLKKDKEDPPVTTVAPIENPAATSPPLPLPTSSESPDDPTPTTLPSPPTGSPVQEISVSQPPTDIITPSFSDRVKSLLPSSTNMVLSNFPDSSQAAAFDWLINDPNAGNYSDWRLVQRYALSTLFFSTNGSSWIDSTNWLSYEYHECTWYAVARTGRTAGIACDADEEEQGYSTLVLKENGLDGTIPEEMYLLSDLAYLSLESNTKLRGTISSLIGKLSQLKGLDISKSGLTGSLPSEVGALTSLQALDISNNDFDGRIPSELGLLTSLNQLSAHYNHLNSSLPTEFGLMTSLEFLDIDKNSLTGTLPSQLGLMTVLKRLYLDTNMLTGTLSTEIGLLTNVMELDLSFNDFTGSLPTEIGNMAGRDPTGFFNADWVRPLHFHLGQTHLQGQIPSEIGRLVWRLIDLRLWGNQLSGSLPTELFECQRLKWLTIQFNRISGVIPSQIGNLREMLALSMTGNRLSGSIPSQVGHMQDLTLLYAANNTMTGSLPSQMGLLSGMEKLKIQDNNFSGTIPVELKNWPQFTYGDLSENSFRGFIPEELVTLKNDGFLEHFDVSGNPELVGTIPLGFCPSIGFELVFDCSDSLCGCSCLCPPPTRQGRARTIP